MEISWKNYFLKYFEKFSKILNIYNSLFLLYFLQIFYKKLYIFYIFLHFLQNSKKEKHKIQIILKDKKQKWFYKPKEQVNYAEASKKFYISRR